MTQYYKPYDCKGKDYTGLAPIKYLFSCALYVKLSKLEKQQQRKEKTRSKGSSESGREKGVARSKVDHSASSGAEGDVSSEREP